MDALELAPRLRKADQAEIKASSGRHPVEVLRDGVSASERAYAVASAGRVVALGGVCRLNDQTGAPWLLGSDDLVKNWVQFLRMSRPWVEHLNATYPVLTNHVDARNAIHIRWLKWLGFLFTETVPEYGVEKRPFFRFERTLHV